MSEEPEFKIATLDARQAWELGIKLWPAIFKFAPAQLREEHALNHKVSSSMEGMAAPVAQLIGFLAKDERVQAEASAKYAQHLEAQSKAKKCLEQMQRLLRGWLRRGELLAWGYRSPREPSHAPQPVPHDLWDGQINWAESAATGGGLTMVGIRVLHPNAIKQEKDRRIRQAVANVELPKPKGRPSFKREIRRAYLKLADSGAFDANAPKTAVYPRIKELLKSEYPGRAEQIDDLAKETLRSAISDLHKPQRRNAKSDNRKS